MKGGLLSIRSRLKVHFEPTSPSCYIPADSLWWKKLFTYLRTSPSLARATAGIEDLHPCLTIDWLLEQFSPRKKKALKLYALFVHEGITHESPWRNLKEQIFLGDPTFVEEITSSVKVTSKEVRRDQRYANRPDLAILLPPRDLSSKDERDKLVTEAHLSCGYTLKEIADHLHVHYATISRAVKRIMGKNV
jgi:hypothetical protein